MSDKRSFLIKSASADITFCSSYCTNTYCDRCTEGNLHRQAVDKPQARAQYRNMSRECEDFRIIRNEVVLPILSKLDSIDGIIYVCPHCHRYVAAERGIKICRICGGKVDNDNRVRYEGYVKFDGEDSWKRGGINE